MEDQANQGAQHTVSDESAPGAAPGARPGWLPPSDGRSSRPRPILLGCLIVLAVFLLAPLAAVAILDNAGTGSGSMQSLGFGTGGSGCTLTGAGRSFSEGSPVRALAMYSPGLQPGSTITVATYRDGVELVGRRQLIRVEEESDCAFVGQLLLEPGEYRVEFALDSSPMSPLSGEFEVTAD